jgi:translation elongation factor EF-Ts
MYLVAKLREICGCSFAEARLALQYCATIELAAAWLRFYGCAVSIKSKENETKEQAYLRWVMDKSKEFLMKEIIDKLVKCDFLYKINNFQLEPDGFSFEYQEDVTYSMLENVSKAFFTSDIQIRPISADYGDTWDSYAVWIKIRTV